MVKVFCVDELYPIKTILQQKSIKGIIGGYEDTEGVGFGD
ncbi:hypothetical protein HME9304_00679 [Flagellimonas maritima]|uniref:Uncharacterized protein n=1 Tax=Flagellimonas maritima TaxID=1383885 RepID=A0A2Z4LQL1_9FLAO|nr:hypothetical protein HME9304_00679 [Allomuricauda aurantiaca]